MQLNDAPRKEDAVGVDVDAVVEATAVVEARINSRKIWIRTMSDYAPGVAKRSAGPRS